VKGLCKRMLYRSIVAFLISLILCGVLFSYLEESYANKKQRLRISSVVLVDAPEKIFWVFRSHNKRVTGVMKHPSQKLIKEFKVIKGSFCDQLSRLKMFLKNEKYMLWYISEYSELKDILCLDKVLKMFPQLLIAEKRPYLRDEHIYPIRDILLKHRVWRSIESFV